MGPRGWLSWLLAVAGLLGSDFENHALGRGPLSLVAEAKRQTTSMRVGGPRIDNKWKYLSKFGYSTGVGSLALRLQVVQPKTIAADATLDVELHLDEHWDETELEPDVCKRIDKARTKSVAVVPGDGSWGPWYNTTLSQSVRPHIWFFALSDCKNNLQNFTHRIKFELIALQEDGSEFSVEQSGMLMVNLLGLAGFSAFIYRFVIRCRVYWRSAQTLHPVIITLAIAMVLQYIGQFFHTFHLWRYSSNGAGIRALEVISEILIMLNQVILSSLLILIGLGYTLLQKNIGDLDLVIPMAFMVAIIHIMLVGFGKIKDDASYKFHENEGIVGWFLMGLRVLLWIWFMWAVKSTASEGGMRLQTFLKQFAACGTCYFWTFPVIFGFVHIFADYYQHAFMHTGTLIMQLASNFWLANLFLERGDYFKVSTLNSSFLPGGARVGLDKEE